MRFSILYCLCWISSLELGVAIPFGNSTVPELKWPGSLTNVQTFKTEPGFKAVKFNFKRRTESESLLSQGYIFLTMAVMKRNNATRGAQIYDNNGNLIWHDLNERAQDLKVSDYLGEHGTHLSVYRPHGKYSQFLDQSYTPLPRKYHSQNGHEFNVLPGGRRALRIQGTKVKINAMPYLGQSNGWLLDNCLVELDVRTGKELFRWCALDHTPVWYTSAYPLASCLHDSSLVNANQSLRTYKAGCGDIPHHPWDCIHSNSIDKYDGDYLFCSRFLDQIIKVAGPENSHGVEPGTVLWRLGGAANDFDKNFTFTKQHHIRYVSVTRNETVISLLNNAWEGTNKPSAKASEGQIIRLNNQTMKAELLHRFPHPDGVLSEGRGNTQLLPNGNVLVGYGRVPELVEYSSDGTVLLHAHFSDLPFELSDDLDILSFDFSYRAFKFPWVGRPLTQPKLIAYSLTCSTSKTSPLIAYVSWNGATEVVAWRFFISSTTKDGPWAPLGDFPRDGFETVAHLSSKVEAKLLKFTPFVRVQGISSTGEVLGARTVKTFVPKQSTKHHCDAYGCNAPTPFTYARKFATTRCEQGWLLPGYIALGLLIILLEICYQACRTLAGYLHDFYYGQYARLSDDSQAQESCKAPKMDEVNPEKH